MAQIWEYIKIALMNIKSNKGRSVLTMLGIIIGIASVILIISIGNGMRSEINSELDSMAGGQVALYTNSSVEGNEVTFTDEDFELIQEKVENVKGVTPQYSMWADAEGKKGNFEALVYAGNTALEYCAATEPIARGRYFTESDYLSAHKVCVLNENSARMLFGTTDVVGMGFDVTIYNVTQELTIVGVREDSKASLISALNGSGYLQIEMPISTLGASYEFWVEDFSQFYIIAENAEDSAQVAADSIRLMENKHNVRGENKILMESFADYQAQFDSILSYEYYARLRDRAYQGNRYPESLGSQDEFNPATVSGGSRHYYTDRRIGWHCPGRGRRGGNLRHVRISGGGQADNSAVCGAFLFGSGNLLRYLSCEESSEVKPD